MSEIPTSQLVFLVILALVIAFLFPKLQQMTGKSMAELFFGSRIASRSPKTPKQNPAVRKPKLTNGSKNDLTIFISKLLKICRKNGMQLVTPAMIEYKGKTAKLLAFIVHPSGVTGVYCLGFGGTITPSAQANTPWKQQMNGENHSFANPLTVCDEQYRLVRAAMDEAGIQADLNVVTVFTTPHTTIQNQPQNVYTQKEFLDYLSETSALKNGSVDIRESALKLAGMVKREKGRK